MAGLLSALAGTIWLNEVRLPVRKTVGHERRELSGSAFNESYLDAANGKINTRRRACTECHPKDDPRTQQAPSLLNRRAALSQEDWAREIALAVKCGACHLVPAPANLPRQSWREVMSRMAQIMDLRHVTRLTNDEFQDILHFYFTFSHETQPLLGEDRDPRESPLK